MTRTRFFVLLLGCLSLLSTFAGHSSAAPSPATVFGWGLNYYGQLGQTGGVYDSNPNPIPQPSTSDVVAVVAGQYHTLTLKKDGTVWAYGFNFNGELGNTTNLETYNESPIPTKIPGLTSVVAIAAGGFHSLFLKSDGTVWTCGDNEFGQLGLDDGEFGYVNPTPIQVQGLTGITSIGAGAFHSLAIKNDGTVWAWGLNFDGQLGNDATTYEDEPNPIPVEVDGVSNVISVAGGAYHSMALLNDGTVWTWGSNAHGQLGVAAGSGSDDAVPTPVQVENLDSVIAIAAGQQHSLAVQTGGAVWAWGDNYYGQLGNATNVGVDTDNPAATEIAGIPEVKAVSGGAGHTLALKDDGTVWAWGDNSIGELGTATNSGTNDPVVTPVQTLGAEPALAIAAGGYHSLSLTNGPAAYSFTQILTDNNPVQIRLRARGVPGTRLSYFVNSKGTHGTITSVQGFYVTYDPGPDFTGQDSFQYYVTDGAHTSNIATVKLEMNAAPLVQSLVPARADGTMSGSGGYSDVGDPLTLTLTITDPNGADTISTGNVNFNNSLSNGNGVVLSYNASTNTMYLRSADGHSLLPGGTPGTNTTPADNGFASLDFANCKVEKTGQYLTVVFAVTPHAPFAGLKHLWAAAKDESKASDGYSEFASWTVREVVPPPRAENFTVGFTAGSTSRLIQLRGSDPQGDPLTYIIDTPPAHGTLTTPSGANVTYTPDGTLATGDSFTYHVTDGTNVSNTATCTIVLNQPPVLVDLIPAKADGSESGSGGSSIVGEPLKLTLHVSDGDGADNLRVVYVTFNKSLTNSNGIALSYDVAGNKLYLRNTDGTTTLGGQAPGSTGTVNNGYATLDFAASTVQKSGNDLTVTFAVTPGSAFTGAKKLWAAARDIRGEQVGFTEMATWTVNPASASLTLRPAPIAPSASGS